MKILKLKIALAASALLFLALFLNSMLAQKTDQLAIGTSIKHTIKGGEINTFEIKLSSGQFLAAGINQKEIDLNARFIGPDGQSLIEFSNNLPLTPFLIYVVAPADGVYKLELSRDAKSESAEYELKIDEIRAAKSEDKDRVAARVALNEADNLRKQGTADSRKKASQKYTEALSLWKSAGDKGGEAETLSALGSNTADLGNNRQAVDYFNQAIEIWHSLDIPKRESAALSNGGLAYSNIGENKKALEYYDRALPLKQKTGDQQGEAAVLNNMGLAYQNLGDFQEALSYFNQALPIAKKIGDQRFEAIFVNNIGLTYNKMGDNHKALEYYALSLPLRRQLGDKRGEGTVLSNMGLSYSNLGELRKALDLYEQSLTLKRSTGDRRGEGITLFNMGVTHASLAETQVALDFFNQAVVIIRAVNDRQMEANIVNNIAMAYHSLGDDQKAVDHYNQALPIYRAVGDKSGEGILLSNFGMATATLGDTKKALEYYEQALALKRTVGDRRGQAYALNTIGQTCYKMHEPQKALEYFNQSLALTSVVADQRLETIVFNGLGLAYFDLGENEKALDSFNKSLEKAKKTGDRQWEAFATAGRGRALMKLSKTAEARMEIESALTILESLRNQINNQELRATYLASMQNYFATYVDLLMQLHIANPSAGHDREALAASEQAKARSLLDLLQEPRVDVSQGIDLNLKSRERDVYSRISWIQSQLIKTSGQAGDNSKRIGELEQDLKKADQDREQIDTEIREKYPKYSELQHPKPIGQDAIRSLLKDDQVLLEYFLGENSSFLFAITKSDFSVFKLPTSKSIEDLIRPFRTNISTRPTRTGIASYILQSRALYQQLLSPAQKLLQGKKELIVVPDGALWYLPFEVLIQPGAAGTDLQKQPYIVRDFAVSYVPSASVLGTLQQSREDRRTARKSFLAFGDPDYGDQEDDLSRSGKPDSRGLFDDPAKWQLKRLMQSRGEVEGIAKLYPAGSTAVFLGKDASEENVKTKDRLSEYRYIHFATHGLINESQPQFSGLVLSLGQQTSTGADKKDKQANAQIEDGLLQVYEIFNLHLDADLVVLSACETGLGKQLNGEGFMGLTRAFLYAGTPSVAVSLWSVDDRSTSDLMVKFYKGMIEDNLSKSQALRSAQKELIREGQYAHPYYWAPFVLVGRP